MRESIKIMNNEEAEILSRLKFIGRVQKGEKINTKYLYVQSVGFFTGISRTFITQDNRANTMDFLQNTISKIFDIFYLYEKSKKQSDISVCINLIKDLKQAKSGIMNLKETYNIDIKFSCDADVLIENINIKINEFENKFQIEKNEEKSEEKSEEEENE